MNGFLLFALVWVPIAIEQLLLFAAPHHLGWLAFLRVDSERYFELPERPRVATEPRGYRDPAGEELAPPPLPARVDVGDAVLFSGGDPTRVALRRAFGWGRRTIWLVRIDVERSGRRVRLTAKEALVPTSLIVAGPVFAAVGARAQILPAAIGLLVVFAVVFGQRYFVASHRDEHLEHAYDAIERAMCAPDSVSNPAAASS